MLFLGSFRSAVELRSIPTHRDKAAMNEAPVNAGIHRYAQNDNKRQATTEILSLRLRMTRSFETRSFDTRSFETRAFDLFGRHFTEITWGTAFQPRRAIWAGPWAAADGYSTWMVRDSPGSSET